MRWDKVEGDAYYEARKHEYMAKRYERLGDVDGALCSWEAFAGLKVSKGSYFLAAYGYYQCSRLTAALSRYEESVSYLEQARAQSSRHGFLLDAFLAYEVACRYEVAGLMRQALGIYEDIGRSQEEAHNYFVAADAYEHAAEIRYALGLPARTYDLPLDAWEKNSLYWQQQGEHDDAEWSQERKKFYRSLYRE